MAIQRIIIIFPNIPKTRDNPFLVFLNLNELCHKVKEVKKEQEQKKHKIWEEIHKNQVPETTPAGEGRDVNITMK